MQFFNPVHIVLLMILLTPAQGSSLTNDFFSGRIRFSGDKVTVTSTSAEATREEGEPWLFHGLGVTLWWGYTAPKNGKVRVTGIVGDELWPNPDVRARLFTGESLETLVDYSPWGFLLSSDGSRTAEFEVVAGAEYQIMTDTIVPAPHIGYRGPVTLSFEYLPTPTNDAFVNRTILNGEALLVLGTTEGATRETGEPRPEKGYDEHTVWYTWTPEASGRVDFALLENANRVTVYTNDTLITLAPVVLEVCCNFTRNNFDAVGGQTYHLAVSSPFNETAPFKFSLSLNGSPVVSLPAFRHYGVEVYVHGRSDWMYRVESSTNLVNWTPLSSGGYVDELPTAPMRFYRAVKLP